MTLQPDQLSNLDEQILDLIREDRHTARSLTKHIDSVGRSQISKRLSRLHEHDHLSKPAHGLYELEDDPRDDVETDGGHDQAVDQITIGVPGIDVHEVDWESVPCEPADPDGHKGRRVMVFAIGPAGDDVRKLQVCSECQYVVEERRFEASALSLDRVGQGVDRVTNFIGEQDHVDVNLDEVIDADEETDLEDPRPYSAGFADDGDTLRLIFAEGDSDEWGGDYEPMETGGEEVMADGGFELLGPVDEDDENGPPSEMTLKRDTGRDGEGGDA